MMCLTFDPCHVFAAFLLLLPRNVPATQTTSAPYNQHWSCIKVFQEWKCNAVFFCFVFCVSRGVSKSHTLNCVAYYGTLSFSSLRKIFLLLHKVSVDLGHDIIHDKKKMFLCLFVNVDIWTSYLRGKTNFSMNSQFGRQHSWGTIDVFSRGKRSHGRQEKSP